VTGRGDTRLFLFYGSFAVRSSSIFQKETWQKSTRRPSPSLSSAERRFCLKNGRPTTSLSLPALPSPNSLETNNQQQQKRLNHRLVDKLIDERLIIRKRHFCLRWRRWGGGRRRRWRRRRRRRRWRRRRCGRPRAPARPAGRRTGTASGRRPAPASRSGRRTRRRLRRPRRPHTRKTRLNSVKLGKTR